MTRLGFKRVLVRQVFSPGLASFVRAKGNNHLVFRCYTTYECAQAIQGVEQVHRPNAI